MWRARTTGINGGLSRTSSWILQKDTRSLSASPWSAQQHYAYSFHQACYPAIPIVIRRLF
jgi:hypothetical protein